MLQNRLTVAIENLQLAQTRTRRKLSDLRHELMSHIDPDDLEDSIPEVMEHEMALSQLREVESRLEAIEHALQRVEQGSYGICEHCGQPIDPARLEVMPETTLCIHCKSRGEQSFPQRMVSSEAEWMEAWRERKTIVE